jgi:CheY-like chemotaxis protein
MTTPRIRDPLHRSKDNSQDPEVTVGSQRKSNLTILVIEDDLINRKMLGHMMKRLGHSADLASNGFEALDALEHSVYDIVLMDILMPVMDGIEATREIRRRIPAERQPIIIAFTAYIVPDGREICIEAGMDDYLTKPATIDELARMIDKHTHSRSK